MEMVLDGVIAEQGTQEFLDALCLVPLLQGRALRKNRKLASCGVLAGPVDQDMLNDLRAT